MLTGITMMMIVLVKKACIESSWDNIFLSFSSVGLLRRKFIHNNNNINILHNYGKNCRMLKGITMMKIVLLMKVCIESSRNNNFCLLHLLDCYGGQFVNNNVSLSIPVQFEHSILQSDPTIPLEDYIQQLHSTTASIQASLFYCYLASIREGLIIALTV